LGVGLDQGQYVLDRVDVLSELRVLHLLTVVFWRGRAETTEILMSTCMRRRVVTTSETSEHLEVNSVLE